MEEHWLIIIERDPNFYRINNKEPYLKDGVREKDGRVILVIEINKIKLQWKI